MKQYTSNNNSTKGIVYSQRNDDYSYEREDNKTLSFFIWVFTAIVIVTIISLFSTITVHAGGIWDTYAYSVPTSLCHDPLLGPSMIIYSDCSSGIEEPKNDNTDELHGVTVITEEPIIPDNPIVIIVEIVIPDTDDIPVQDTDTPIDDTVEAPISGNPGNDKPVGNSGEKCDKNMCENTDGITGEHGKSKKD